MNIDSDVHETYDTWKLYAHLPHDTDWTIHSYKYITSIQSVEELLSIQKHLQDSLIKNCMLFLMRNDIMPIWEDVDNIHGGCISYKVNVDDVPKVWKELSCYTVCENMSTNLEILQSINGITISPKKRFGILKVWLNKSIPNPKEWINPDIRFLNHDEAIFKKHIEN